jgi:hypothetical protein
MQIQFREVKGGFECIHAPSIDLTSLGDAQARTPPGSLPPSQDVSASSTVRKGVVRKASKLSFATIRRKEKEKEKEKEKGHEKEATTTTAAAPSSVPVSSTASKTEGDKDLPHRPSTAGLEPPAPTDTKLVSPSGGSSSFFNVPSVHPANEDVTETTNDVERTSIDDKSKAVSVHTNETGGIVEEDDTTQEATAPSQPTNTDNATNAANTTNGAHTEQQTETTTQPSPTKEKYLPPIPKDFAVPSSPTKATTTATTTVAATSQVNGNNNKQVIFDNVFENSNTSDLIVRFEIMIVKVRSHLIISYFPRLYHNLTLIIYFILKL